MQHLTAFIPIDRRQALAQQTTLPNRTTGAVLFADISGFTALTEALTTEIGRKRGAEELLRQINPIYEALIGELYRYGGSVIGFAGDAMTCWLSNNDGQATVRAVVTALGMQEVMQLFSIAYTPQGTSIQLGIKVAVAFGSVRRFVVGDPHIQLMDVLAGKTLTRMAQAEQQTETGEVVVSEEVATHLGDSLQISAWREDSEDGSRFAVIDAFVATVPAFPHPPIDFSSLTERQLQIWALPAVAQQLQAGEHFLGDLRLVASLFLKFAGIDYDQDENAGEKLDAYVRWVQRILQQYGGDLLKVIIGDKGAYLYAAFGVLLAHEDDTTRAVMAALALQEPPPALSYIGQVQIGVTQGQVWTGACGSTTRHDYTAIGNWVNMAARLMAKAKRGQVLVSQAVATSAQARIRFRDLGTIQVKGRVAPLPVAEAVTVEAARQHLSEQFTQPMVGRETELEQLLMWLDEVETGKGYVVTIEAEAGLGKSRLIAEWARQLRTRGLRGFLGTAQSIEQHTPYRAWRDLLSSFLGLDDLVVLAKRQKQVETRVNTLNPETIRYLPLLNDILNLALSDNHWEKWQIVKETMQVPANIFYRHYPSPNRWGHALMKGGCC